jgi:hypothetical protein
MPPPNMVKKACSNISIMKWLCKVLFIGVTINIVP